MKRYEYEISVESSVIISPRGQQVFFEEYRIYPFYQYGAYDKYDPAHAQYYIPGSSIKGAMKTPAQKKFRVDDICLNHCDIQLDYLYKVQHILDEEKLKQKNENGDRKLLKLDIFFSNVKFEMLKPDCRYLGQVFGDESQEEVYRILEETKTSTIKKLKVYQSQIGALLSRYKKYPPNQSTEGALAENQSIEQLKKVSGNISSRCRQALEFNKNESFLFLGGYKGLLLSREFQNAIEAAAVQSGIFVDVTSNLPYGLVKIKVITDE